MGDWEEIRRLAADFQRAQSGTAGVYIRVAPDTVLAGYPANIFAGYSVSGRISSMAGYPVGMAGFPVCRIA